MKLIIACYFAVIVPILTFTDGSENDGSKNIPAHTLNHMTGDNSNLATFKENKILIAEFSGIVKDNVGDLISSPAEKIKRQELIKRVGVD